MRRYTSIKVNLAAVHMVAPKRDFLRQSTAPLELDDGVQTFLTAHITKGLADSQAMAGRFKVLGVVRAEGLCRSIASGTGDFVKDSASIAKLLFDASSRGTGTDARVSDGALVVARCSATDHNGDEATFVAILKLDPADAFSAEEGTGADGQPVLRLVQQHDVLPTPKERLQKAAFVRSVGHEYDALALDHQRRGEIVSEFFLDQFLGLEHVFDAKVRTEKLYKTLHRTFSSVKDSLSDDQYHRIDQYIRGQVVGGRVNTDNIVENLPATEQVKKQFAEALADALPDKEFDTDSATAERLLKRRRFRGDNNLAVAVPAEFYGDMVVVTPPSAPGGEYTVTIRTKEWSER